jgi:hypothetical protein
VLDFPVFPGETGGSTGAIRLSAAECLSFLPIPRPLKAVVP